MEIKNLTDFVENCLSLEQRKNGGKSDDERVLFFRGETQERERLIPVIYHPHFDVLHEDRIFKEIIATFPDEMLAKKTTIEKLIFMRHYELPTRLLDISRNPLVGLFFACYREQQTEQEKDGRVYVFSVPEKDIKFCDSDSVTLVANICKQPPSFSVKGLSNLVMEDFNREEQIACLIHDARDDKPHFQKRAGCKEIESVICLHPLMNNERIKRQDGYFFLFGIDGDKKKCAKFNESWIVERIRVPKEAKKQILKDLDFLHINESSLYADYKHLSNGIQEKYRNRQKAAR
jgi:hypothetical protein